ncbi:lantibiotic dehydratase C-terminal domain-containing protein [Hamadaea tsunoensis]|uniref:lantibiotic dehydratase C-terminal domain-containing protein n=1 Tax=Hamadaea tsunoensis TaxID=53368 RepID=UPI0004033B18|nr:lantibiotic dehydratase C-terminal domain-containing protein [Hamadaea tsunoensis]
MIRALVASHHDADKRALLRDCLVPLARGVPGAFLERHWLRGPHVRLAVPAGTPEAPLLADVAGYLRRNPSRQPVDPVAYARLSRELGRSELVAGPYEPVRADNTAVMEDYPEQDSVALLGEAGFALKRRILARAVEPLAHGLEALDRGRHRVVVAMGALIANATRWPIGGLATGQLSYRSHLEDFLANNDADGQVRTLLAARFAANEDSLRAAFRAQVSATDHGRYTGDDPYPRAWSEAFDDVWPALLEASQAGEVTEDVGPGYLSAAREFDERTERQWRFGPDRPSSDFHHELGKLRDLPERVHVSEFAAYRFVTNQVTRWLPLLGISPVERYFASFAVCELTEQEFGVSWRDQLAAIRRDPHARISEGNPT